MTLHSERPLAAGADSALGSRPGGRRAAVGVLVWLTIIAGACALFALGWQLFGMALGAALHADVSQSEQASVFWGLVIVAGILAVIAVIALAGRRWVAVALALSLAAGGAFVAVGLFPGVRGTVAPAEEVVPGPVSCQCSSGSVCDCPGG